MRHIDQVTVTVAACVMSVLTAVGTAYCDSKGHEHYAIEGRTHIHDIGYDLIPHVDAPWIVKRALEYLWIAFLPYARNPVRLATEITFVSSVVLLLRLASMSMTILPDPGHKDASMSFKKMFEGGVHDKVFSGHTAFSTIVALAFIRNGVWNRWGYMYPFSMAFFMVATRGHYTVDVFLGFVIAYLVYALFFY